MSNFLSLKNIDFPGVILDVLLGSMELAIEMVIKITEDFKILTEVKSLHFERLGSIDVRFSFINITRHIFPHKIRN